MKKKLHMKPLLILISILFGFLSIQAQYDYPYDNGNHYYDNAPIVLLFRKAESWVGTFPT